MPSRQRTRAALSHPPPCLASACTVRPQPALRRCSCAAKCPRHHRPHATAICFQTRLGQTVFRRLPQIDATQWRQKRLAPTCGRHRTLGRRLNCLAWFGNDVIPHITQNLKFFWSGRVCRGLEWLARRCLFAFEKR